MSSAYGAWCVGEDSWTAEKSLVFKKQNKNKRNKKKNPNVREMSMCAECFLRGLFCVCWEEGGGGGRVALRCVAVDWWVVVFFSFVFPRKQVPVLFPRCLPERGKWKSEREHERERVYVPVSEWELGIVASPPPTPTPTPTPWCVRCPIKRW